MRRLTIRRLGSKAALLGVAGLLLTQPACTWEGGGNFSLFGYSTTPNYRTNIRSVRVPIFKNRTYIQGLEFDMTEAVCHAISQVTPYRVVNGDGPADTELIGTITIYQKGSTLNGPSNEVLQQEIDISVELTWKDLRTGEILSRPGRRPGEPARPDAPVPPLLPDPTLVGQNPPGTTPSVPGLPSIPTTPTLPGTPGMPALGTTNPAPGTPGSTIAAQGNVPPVVVKATITHVAELGSSTTAARAKANQQIATQIVSLMEKPW